MTSLQSKNIILGVCGGVAAYKSVELCRLLIKAKANVQVVMTKSALEFIKPLSFQSITGNKVRNYLFDLDAEQAMGHIELARWTDFIIIAPATANTIAKLSYGMADDLLLTLCLASIAKIFIAPAMNKVMYEKKMVQNNIERLKEFNINIIGPDYGEQACGDIGYGRMVEPERIKDCVSSYVERNNYKFNLNNKNILITAGPTQEYPIRYISNKSSGKMGYNIAQAAAFLGATVTLVSGPVDSKIKDILNFGKINLINVESALQMKTAVHNNIKNQDIFISTAAVVDYKSKDIALNKIKKSYNELDNNFKLDLILNDDVALSVGDLKQKDDLFKNLITVGFAAETDEQQALDYAQNKLKNKKFNIVFLNNVADKTIGFNSDLNEVTAVWHKSNKFYNDKLAKCSKKELAYKILEILYNKIICS